MDDNKAKALKVAMDQIEKQYGKGAIMRLGDNRITDVEALPTGSLSLDIALGIGINGARRRIEQTVFPQTIWLLQFHQSACNLTIELFVGCRTLVLHFLDQTCQEQGIVEGAKGACAIIEQMFCFVIEFIVMGRKRIIYSVHIGYLAIGTGCSIALSATKTGYILHALIGRNANLTPVDYPYLFGSI